MSPRAIGTRRPTAKAKADAREYARRGQAANERGDRVPSTLAGYEHAAREGGTDAVAEALIARANRRWRNVVAGLGFPAAIVLPRLHRLASIDAGLLSLGLPYDVDIDPDIAPASYGRGWLGHLRGGADSVAAAGRLLLLSQPVGAAALIRHQLERWTDNRAKALGIERPSGDSKAAYIERVWRGGWELRLSPKQLYEAFSELLHGRGRLTALARWEATDLAEWPMPPAAGLPVMLLPDAATLVLQQITACVKDLAERAGRPELARWLMDWPRTSEAAPFDILESLRAGILPLMPPMLTRSFVLPLMGAEQAYLDVLPRLSAELSREPSLPALAFLHRRHRATQAAIGSFEAEEQMRGRDFKPANLAGREARYILIWELAAILGSWQLDPIGESFAVASSAARSSFILWLEDDSRAMIPVRTVLECVARARTWRLKPDRAKSLDARGPRTTTRDWLAAAGWRRLGLLNAALGELSHSSYDARYAGALGALSVLQEPQTAGPNPIHTARGDALDQTMFLLASEAIAAVDSLNPYVASVARQTIRLPDDADRQIEAWLSRAWEHRHFDFGGPSFGPIDLDQLRSLGIKVD